MNHDLLIVGGGPSGIALACAAEARGLDVCIAAAGGLGQTQATLSLFADEAGDAPLRSRAERTVVKAVQTLSLQRSYAVLDVPAFAAAVPARVKVVRAQAQRVLGHADGVRVPLNDGTVLSARAVVDASGAVPALVQLERARPAYQTAFGRIVEGDLGLGDHAVDASTAVLMDWSAAGADDASPPSFLYAIPMGAHRTLLEETVLCARPAVSLDLLRTRLDARLLRMGIRDHRIVEEERVSIPMATGLPRRGQQVAAFGGALGLIHPATGYSVGRSIALAPLVADAVALALAENDTAHVGDRVLDAVWTPTARDARAVFLVALEAARRFSRAEAQRFFHAFFSLPQHTWRGFLDGTLASPALRAAMTDLFMQGDTRQRVALAKGLFAPSSLNFIRGSFGGVQ